LTTSQSRTVKPLSATSLPITVECLINYPNILQRRNLR
jgi:hypothetical protein